MSHEEAMPHEGAVGREPGCGVLLRVLEWPVGRARWRPPRSRRPRGARGAVPGTLMWWTCRQAARWSPSSASIVQRRERWANVSESRSVGVSTSNRVRGPVIAG